jgi:hypothetical protein
MGAKGAKGLRTAQLDSNSNTTKKKAHRIRFAILLTLQ